MNIYNQISSNRNKSILIIVLFIIFITTIGYLYGKYYDFGIFAAVIAFTASIFSSIGSYFYSDKIILSSLKAKKINKQDNPTLFNTVENICIAAGIDAPKIYIMEDESPNAFATGRNPKNSSVCVTTGLLNIMSKSELEGVISHEISHIKNLDTRLMMITAILVGFTSMISNFFLRGYFLRSTRKKVVPVVLIFLILSLILSPIVATLMQLAISRKREFLADASGALLTRYPEGLASALEKISNFKTPVKNISDATAHLFIDDPKKSSRNKNFLSGFFNTHPSIEERIRILRSM